MIDPRTVQRIIDRAEIADVVGDYLTLHRKGRDYVALCPFHDDTSPSLHISTTKNFCKCFACNEGGTPVSFLMKYEHITFPEAIKQLGRKYGIEVVEQELTPQQLERKTERERLLNANAFARDEFVNAMHQGAEGRMVGLSYFRERGLTDETIKEFELGYSPSDWTYLVDQAKEKGVDIETLEELGLVMKTKKGDYIDRYRERVIFPIHSSSGNVVGFGGRILKKVENVGKYINSPASTLYDKSNELYGLYFSKKQISKSNKCIVLEGYMDVLSMYQRGVRNVVASSGTALTHTQVQHIKRLASNVTLLFDADSAGLKAAMRGLDICLELDLEVNILVLPEGEDPDSFAQTHTLEDIEAYITEHEEDALFFKGRMLAAEHGTEPQGRVAIVEELAQSLAYISSKIKLDLYLNAVAERWEVTVDALKERVKQIQEERRRNQQRSEYQQRQREESNRSNTFTNLSTKATTGQVTSKVAPPKLKDPLAPYELTLLHDIIDYGNVFMADYTTQEGQEGAYGLQVINDATHDLRELNQLSDNFVQLIDDLLIAQEADPAMEISKYLLGQENDTIREYTDRYLVDKYSLSPKHEKFVTDMEQPEELSKMILKDVLSLKLYKIEEQINEVLTKLKELSTADEEGYKALYQRLNELVQFKSNASYLMGDRVITPTMFPKK